tara:strand:+ start:243 stop:449 length:207 start_codon:yes stop_codon:yes gene_type:complete
MKKYFKRLWNALWASTDLDERALSLIEEGKIRVNMLKKELEDIKKEKRNKGRKPNYKNKKKTNNNTKK